MGLDNPDITDLQMLQVTVHEDGHLLVTATAQISAFSGTNVVGSVGTAATTEGPIVADVQFQGTGNSLTNFVLTGGIAVSARAVNLYHNCRQDSGADGDAVAQQTAMTVVFSASRL